MRYREYHNSAPSGPRLESRESLKQAQTCGQAQLRHIWAMACMSTHCEATALHFRKILHSLAIIFIALQIVNCLNHDGKRSRSNVETRTKGSAVSNCATSSNDSRLCILPSFLSRGFSIPGQSLSAFRCPPRVCILGLLSLA